MALAVTRSGAQAGDGPERGSHLSYRGSGYITPGIFKTKTSVGAFTQVQN